MRIYFERTGGFMGLRTVADIDTAELPEDEAHHLQDLLDAIDFFELPTRLESASPGMDQFHYVLSVSMESTELNTTVFDDSGEHETPPETEPQWHFGNSTEAGTDAHPTESPVAHTVEFTDAAAPPDMQALVRLLTRLARGQHS